MDLKDYKSGQSESNFWFKAKKEMVDVLSQKVAKGRKNLKILNLGAGTGTDLEILNKYGDVYVIDIDEEALNLISNDLYFEKKVADACKLPYKDNFFDIVTSFDVFEHIPDDSTAVAEVRRVLKKNGRLLFSVPAFQFLFSSHDRALEHQRRYNKKMLKKLFAEFHTLKLNYWNFILFFPIAFVRLIKDNSEAKLDHKELPKLIDSFFFSLLKIENQFIKYNINPPIGLTLRGYCQK